MKGILPAHAMMGRISSENFSGVSIQKFERENSNLCNENEKDKKKTDMRCWAHCQEADNI